VILRLATMLLVGVPGVIAAQAVGGETSWSSRSDKFRVSYESDLRPLVINRIHTWILHVETADGKPVDGAGISVTGGMPEHDHGLPTAPEVRRNLGHGDYLVEGLRFHMSGYWELELTITANGETDTVVIPLRL
jgi:hypothetical protein